MPDNKSGPLTSDLIRNCMNEAARELGTMDPAEPRGAALVAELSQLMQLRSGTTRKRSACRSMHGRASA